MTPEQLLDVLRQYYDLWKPSGLTLIFQWISVLSPIFMLISIIVVYGNVNRTIKKTKENDIEKFKRELGWKSAEEIIEAITKVKESYHDLLAIKEIWRMFSESKVDLNSILEHLRKCEGQFETTAMIAIQYKKREIVLKEFDPQVQFVYEKGSFMATDLSELIGYLTDKAGYTDEQISTIVDRIDKNGKEMTLHLNKLLRDVQNKFLSEYYGEELI
ncbi:hypothetical protein [Paenibacillus polymyxa]|uniref:Uncharacterized protein n=1 Tax=Paenibacillus polymyxa TaxID=1406 RepID=A0AAE9L6Y6_PAEPO|nr:hypothetical protein [Paenibacillus polymyxa]URJ50716.1 hypothetical protein MF626_000082 [Paenibacillus polymyxa]